MEPFASEGLGIIPRRNWMSWLRSFKELSMRGSHESLRKEQTVLDLMVWRHCLSLFLLSLPKKACCGVQGKPGLPALQISSTGYKLHLNFPLSLKPLCPEHMHIFLCVFPQPYLLLTLTGSENVKLYLLPHDWVNFCQVWLCHFVFTGLSVLFG